MIIYPGSVQDSHELIQFFRLEAARLRNLRKLIVTPEHTVVKDVNGDGIEFPGLTYGSMVLEDLFREMGVIFNPESLHNPKATASGIKEFTLSGRWTWAHDRVM